jgi:GAF domain-containing protein
VDLSLFILDLLNETLAATIVVLAASILLYNFTRNFDNRIARTSAFLLGCVTITYLADVFVSLGPELVAYEAALRLQWLGIAFMPATIFHLSDALLATTGLPSRGRRRLVVRLMYIISAGFLLTAMFSNALIVPTLIAPTISERTIAVGLQAGILFPVYMLYFVIAVVAAFINANRARLRCLTRATRRRMGYLQYAMLTPAIGIFPFSVVLGTGTEFSLIGLILVNAANLFMVLMLLFLAYPLSFFGSNIPDRVVKTELLRFVLRGPMTGLLALLTYIFTNATSRILGLQGEQFTPFAIVAVILLWQWGIALALPWLERRLVYGEEDFDQLDKLQHLSERVLTRTDLVQLIETLLAATCNYLRVNTAFIAALTENGLELVRAVGASAPAHVPLGERSSALRANLLTLDDEAEAAFPILTWEAYWLIPLHGHTRNGNLNGARPSMIGVLGIQARGPHIDLTEDERTMLDSIAVRAGQALEDTLLQGEIFAALEGLLPQINLTRRTTEDIQYRPGRAGLTSPSAPPIDREQFNEQVRAALRHYYGGPGLSNSRLLDTKLVRSALPDNDNNSAKALRTVLNKAIQRLRPQGEPKPLNREWTFYTIIDLRFLKGLKVREVANRLSISEPDFYRKQREAIDSLADELWKMEAEQ